MICNWSVCHSILSLSGSISCQPLRSRQWASWCLPEISFYNIFAQLCVFIFSYRGVGWDCCVKHTQKSYQIWEIIPHLCVAEQNPVLYKHNWDRALKITVMLQRLAYTKLSSVISKRVMQCCLEMGPVTNGHDHWLLLSHSHSFSF